MVTVLPMSERDLQDTVVEYAQRFGWLVHHDRPARTKHGGWVTAVQGNRGFPDVLAVRGRRIVVAELKSPRAKPTLEQTAWLDRFAFAGVDTYVWRPDDWQEIVAVLGRNR